MSEETRNQTPAEVARMRVVMSWSSTQKAIYNQMGRVALFQTDEQQEAYRQGLIDQLERAECDAVLASVGLQRIIQPCTCVKYGDPHFASCNLGDAGGCNRDALCTIDHNMPSPTETQ